MVPKVELEWLIHYKCNYRCPYCFFDSMWEEVEKRNDYQSPKIWLEAWRRILKKYVYVRILITGGEPFIHPFFIDILRELSKDFSIGFDTNLSCSKEELARLVENTVVKNISIGLSFHPKFAEFEVFLEKALFLKKSGFHISIQYVSYPQQVRLIKYYRDRFEDRGLYFIPLPFRGVYNGMDYPTSHTDEEKKLIYSTIENLAMEHKERVEKQLNQVKSKARICRAGQSYARIDNDGTVYRCARSVSNPLNKPIGNFFDENFELLEVPMPCEEDICPCEFRWLVREDL